MTWVIVARTRSTPGSNLWWCVADGGWNLLEERATQFARREDAVPLAFRVERQPGITDVRVIELHSQRVPRLDIVCDHKGGPGALDDNGELNEYHCDQCCPGASVGPSGEQGPCMMHAEGRAVSLLEARPVYIPHNDRRTVLYSAWRATGEGAVVDISPYANVEGPVFTVSIDDAEMLALDILQTVGMARRSVR